MDSPQSEEGENDLEGVTSNYRFDQEVILEGLKGRAMEDKVPDVGLSPKKVESQESRIITNKISVGTAKRQIVKRRPEKTWTILNIDCPVKGIKSEGRISNGIRDIVEPPSLPILENSPDSEIDHKTSKRWVTPTRHTTVTKNIPRREILLPRVIHIAPKRKTGPKKDPGNFSERVVPTKNSKQKSPEPHAWPGLPDSNRNYLTNPIGSSPLSDNKSNLSKFNPHCNDPRNYRLMQERALANNSTDSRPLSAQGPAPEENPETDRALIDHDGNGRIEEIQEDKAESIPSIVEFKG
jgi:hypothetical protein